MGEGSGGQRPIEGFRQYEKERIETPPEDDDVRRIQEVESSTEAPKKRKRQEMESSTQLEGLATPERPIEQRGDLEPSPFQVKSPQSMKKQSYSNQKHADFEFLPDTEPLEETAPLPDIPEEAPAPSTTQTAAPRPPTPTQAPAPPTPTPTVQPTQPQEAPQQSQDDSSQQDTQQQPAPTPAPAPPPTKQTRTAEKKVEKHTLPTEQTVKKTGEKPPTKGKAKPQEADAPAIEKPPEEAIAIQREKSKKTDEEKTAEMQTIAPTDTTAPPPATAVPQQAPPSPLARNPELFALFDKMVSYIQIARSKEGVETTTVHIELKNSVFDGARLRLERFPTAPKTFNVHLEGTPKAVELFNAGARDLAAAFKGTQYDFDVNIQRATLLEDYRARTKRVHRKEETDNP